MLSVIGCCGVVEFQQLRFHETSLSALKELCEWRYQEDMIKRPFVLFSQTAGGNHAGTYGDRLAAYIVKRKLGTVTSAPEMLNGNTNRKIKVWLFGINERALKAWAADHDIEPDYDYPIR